MPILKNEEYIMMITRGKWTLSKEGYSFIEKTKKNISREVYYDTKTIAKHSKCCINNEY